MNDQNLNSRYIGLAVMLVAVTTLAGPAFAQPTAEGLLLWNRFESEENVTNSDYGPGFQLTSYIYDHWEEARIEPAVFGNGLYVNHDTNEGWSNDGANFFAVDLWDVGLTPQRGTIEYWFKFKYASSFHNHAHFFMAMNELTGHLPGPPSAENTSLYSTWVGWNLPDRKYYWFAMQNTDWSPSHRKVTTPVGSAGPGGSLEFQLDSLHHFGFAWDVDGIDASGDTMQLYVNGNLEASTTETWDTTDPVRRYLYLGSTPNYGSWDTYYNAVKGVTDNLKIWDYAKTDFSDRFVESPFGYELELVAEVPPTGGITVEYIQAIQGLDSTPNEIVFASRNVGAGCGGGTPVSAWKLILDPDTGEMVDLSLKQHLSMIQEVRNTLFEASDGTLFTGGGWCQHKPPYFSTDGGESWQPATQGVHPPNSTFSFAEFNGQVYAGTGYQPWHGQVYRWLGPAGPNHWELVVDIAPPRSIVNSVATYDGRLFVSSCIYWWNGCSTCPGTVPVYVSTDGGAYSPTTGIPSCHTVHHLTVVGDDLVAWTSDCGTQDYYMYHWNAALSTWELVNAIPLGVHLGRLVSHEDTLYIYAQATGVLPAGIYRSGDLGQTWEPLALLDSPRVFSLHVHEDALYVGTERDANDIAYIYRIRFNEPPVCDADGPYDAECAGATTSIELDGSGSYDPDPGDTLSYAWTSDCPGAGFDDPTSATPTLTLTSGGSCEIDCSVYLTVTDSEGASSDCSATVTVVDTTPPTATCPEDMTVECDGACNVDEFDAWYAGFGASDVCGDVSVMEQWSLLPICGQSHSLRIARTVTDDCGLSDACSATFTFADTTPPVITCPDDVTVTCGEPTDPDATGWATATDICNDPPTITYDDVVTPTSCPADPVMYTIARTWTATDVCDNSASCVQTIAVMKLVLDLDIKPGSCPNSFNRNSHGVLPVGLLGTEEFDVTTVDLSSVVLSRADCVGGSVAPHEGPPGPHTVISDVGTPFEGEPCACHELGGDGIDDLSMKFKTDDLVPALELDDLSPGALVELVVSGTLDDGCEFIAADCVRLVPPGTPPGMLTVQSNTAGAWIDLSPLDDQLDGGGFADFERTFPLGTLVTLTAPDSVGSRTFKRWVIDGVPQPVGSAPIELTVTGSAHNLEVRYSVSHKPGGLGSTQSDTVGGLDR